MADDKTVRMVTNLDRGAIEGKLAEVQRCVGQAEQIASMFRRRRHASADRQRVKNAIKLPPTSRSTIASPQSPKPSN
jgi:hypothetical protein